MFIFSKNEVRASTHDWNSLGLRGNLSGPLILEGKFGIDRLIGSYGEAAKVSQLIFT